ncbi:MAG: phosphatidylglycerophosphatase A [bacterium]
MARKYMPWYVYTCEGYGLGRLPVAPGTWGSLGATILYSGGYKVLPVWMLGLLTGLLLVGSIPLCNWASLYLAQQDPRNVILDEIVGQWIALFPLFWFPHWPHSIWAGFLAGFFCFRVFDVLKIFPINYLQNLKGGWGIVMDDVLAGAFANGTLFLTALYVL